MTLIITDIATVKEVITVNAGMTFANIKPSLNQAQRVYIKPYLGALLETLATTNYAGADAVTKEAIDLCRESVANFAYMLYIPTGSVNISNSGFTVPQSEHVKAADWKQINDLRRSFIETANQTLDDLLLHLEANPVTFATWVASRNYTQQTKYLVASTAVFNEWFYIYNSRLTYIALVPTIALVTDKYILPLFCQDLIDDLKTDVSVEYMQLREYLQKAIVALTVNEAVDNGMFKLTPRGLQLKFNSLPNETRSKTQTTDHIKFINSIKKRKKTEALEYLKLALAYKEANTLLFTQCPVVVDLDPPSKAFLKDTTGLLGI